MVGGGGTGGAGGKPFQTHRRARSDPIPQLTGRQPHAVPGAAVPLMPGGAFVNIDEEESVVVDDEEVHARAKERWAMLMLAVKRMVKATAMFRLLHYDFLADEPAKAKLPKIETFANHKVGECARLHLQSTISNTIGPLRIKTRSTCF